MDLVTILISTLLSAVVQTSIIVILYNVYIIPRIVERVRDELMDKISGWVDEIKALIQCTIVDKVSEVKDSTAAEIQQIGKSVKGIISGTRGNERRIQGLAKKFLDANLPDDDDDSDEAADLRTSVIEEGIGKYGERIIRALLRNHDIEPVKEQVQEW